ncbi:ABC transporter permease [Paracoccus lutimaris]|uniref:Putative spermidine/putrescine transport system permease protein n=1 Tax=Paracoccus lutimaris TaxID=1490030 RepID=A0A368Z567_9RHOB|nr:ABC transporter permease [Paracoccus lutimaris]RCW87119.1 putative spermidine/putrescine transport system permease protein [Paracoccus lutimaris]
MTSPSQKLVIWALVWFAILILTLPIVIVVAASVTSGNMIAFPPEGFSLKWYRKILEARELRQAFWRSLQVSAICVLVSVPVGTLAGIALTRYRLRFAAALQVYLLLPFTVPLIASGIGMMLVFGEWRILGQVWPVGIACAAINLPFIIWSVSSSAAALDRDLELAAQNCGAGPVATFLHVTLPAVMPGVITGGLLMFVLAMTEFLVSLLLTDARTVTLPVQVYNNIRSIITPDLAAVSTVFIIIAFAAVWLLDRLVGLDIFLKSK